MLKKCPHHGFSPLHQTDTFYNGLNQSDQDSLNSAAGGNLLTRNTPEALTIIENKSKVRTSRNTSSSIGSSSQNDAITALTKQVEALGKHILDMQKPVHSIQVSCETCSGPHPYYECQAAGGYTQRDVYAAMGNYNAVALNERPQGVLPSNTIPNPREDIKVVTTQSGITLAGPSVPPPPPSSSSKEVERDPKTTTDQMFKKLHFNISLAEALAQMPKYAKMLKDLLTNKEKHLESANTPLNENCSAILLKKLPENLETLGNFSFLLMLPELIPTCMTLELANRSVAYPTGIAEDVFVTARALVDVYGEELALRVGDEKLIFNVESTSKYPHKHGDESINRIDIINTTCEDHFHEVLNV
ncbi:hypothetical protein Tco_0968394 [Tanacetum coccineum]